MKEMKIWKPRIAVIALIITVITLNLISDIRVLIPVALFITGFAVRSRNIRVKSLTTIVFLALALLVMQAVTIGTDILYQVNVKLFSVHFYTQGIQKGMVTFFRILGNMGSIFITMGATNQTGLVGVLQWFRVPKAFIEVMMIAIKYIYIFKEDILSIRKAQRARLGYGSFGKSVRTTGNIGGIVLCRAYDRSKILLKAMKSRGYDGTNMVNNGE